MGQRRPTSTVPSWPRALRAVVKSLSSSTTTALALSRAPMTLFIFVVRQASEKRMQPTNQVPVAFAERRECEQLLSGQRRD